METKKSMCKGYCSDQFNRPMKYSLCSCLVVVVPLLNDVSDS